MSDVISVTHSSAKGSMAQSAHKLKDKKDKGSSKASKSRGAKDARS